MEGFIDLHCHPAMKPLGHSFKRRIPTGENSPNKRKVNSIWHYDPPTFGDKIINRALAGATKFRQADLTTVTYGNGSVLFASLYPLERRFVDNKAGTGLVGDLLENFAMGISKARIDHVQEMKDYFKDLELEYNFYKSLSDKNKVIKLEDGKARYLLVNSYQDIISDQQNPKYEDVHTIYIFLTIEGAHVFNTGLFNDDGSFIDPDEQEVLDNVKKVLAWDYVPKFITFAHHFWNHLCGHAPSLKGMIAKMIDQSYGMNERITALGQKVMYELLNNENRVLIDIKHMSTLARKTYYEILETEYATDKVPLIVSHGAPTGTLSADKPNDWDPARRDISAKLMNAPINFYDDEIVKVAKSEGLFGIQMDERRLANKKALKRSNRFLASRYKRYQAKSELLWNQIRYIGELLDSQGLPAWEIQSVGSDFDGMIDPINMFWTSEDMPMLEMHLNIHAERYMQRHGSKLQSFNRIDPDEIIDKFMHENAMDFIEENF